MVEPIDVLEEYLADADLIVRRVFRRLRDQRHAADPASRVLVQRDAQIARRRVEEVVARRRPPALDAVRQPLVPGGDVEVRQDGVAHVGDATVRPDLAAHGRPELGAAGPGVCARSPADLALDRPQRRALGEDVQVVRIEREPVAGSAGGGLGSSVYT